MRNQLPIMPKRWTTLRTPGLVRALITAFFLMVCSPLALAQESKVRTLFPVVQNGKWGFIDAQGQIIISPRFDYARQFSEGLAPVELEKQWGFIDEAGRWVVEPKYQLALPFSEGLAQVRSGGEWSAEPVYLTGGTTSYLDRTGKVVFTLLHSPLGTSYDDYTFSGGLLPMGLGRDKYGYIDKTGRVVIRARFDHAGSFSEGLAGVWVGDYIGFIDRNGKFAIRPRFPIAGWGYPNRFSEELVSVPMGKKMGYIDKMGKVIIVPLFYKAESFSEGLAAVQIRESDHLDGYVDRTGRIAIKPRFEIAGHFQEGLAAVRIGGKWGFINKDGMVVIEPRFHDVHRFSGGLAEVWIDRKLGYIDRTGKYVWEPTR